MNMKRIYLVLAIMTAYVSSFAQTTNPTPTKFINGLGSDTYFNLPTQASPPTSPQLRVGSMYHNSVTGLYMKYNGSTWTSVAMTSQIGDSLLNVYKKTQVDGLLALKVDKSLNLSDLPNITMARDNLRVQSRLRSVVAKVGLLNAGVPVTINYMPIGDSIRQDLLSANFLTSIQQAYGSLTSQHGGGNQLGVAYTTTGGTTRTGAQILLSSLTSVGTTATANATAHGLSNGNSVTISGATNTVYNGTFTISGVTTNTFNYTIASSTTSPDPSPNIYYSTAQDYNKWVTGSFYTVPISGTLTYAKGQSSPGYSSGFTKIKVFYISEIGGGTFKVQTSLDGTAYTDVAGYTSVSASDTQNNLGILTIPNPSSTTAVSIRIVGLTGSVKIAGLGYENISGSKYTDMVGDGGLLLKNMAITPERIWGAYLSDFQPDVITEYIADDVDAGYIAALTTLQGYFSKYAPNATVIYPSVYNARKDDVGYTPTPPFSQLNSTQNAAILTFLAADANPTEKYYWDAQAYVGTWSSSSARGMHDASVVSNVNTLSISGSTITVTTATPHTLSSGSVVRIIGATPNEYNGLYLTSTVTGANTLTVTAGSLVPTVSGIGGNIASVDGIHLGENGGRTVLSQQFMRDFPELTGFGTNYPFKIGAEALKREPLFFPKDGSVNFTGDFVGTSTTATTGAGTVTAPSNTAAMKVYGGIHAGGVIKTDLGLQIGSGSPSPTTALGQFTYSSTNTAYTNILSNLTQNVNATGNYNTESIRANTTMAMSGTANNNSGNPNGIVSDFKWTSSGTGSSFGRGVYSTMTNQSSGTANGAIAFDSYQQNNAGATMSNPKGLNVNGLFNGTLTGIQPRAINIQTGYNNLYAFYNEGSGKVYTGFGNVGVGTSTPTAILDIAQSSATSGTASTTATSGTVIGIGTTFNTTFKVGGTITINSETRTISSIASATSMTTDSWTNTNANLTYSLPGGETGSRLVVQGNGRLNIGNTGVASATVHIKPGSAIAGNAPIKLMSGTILTTPEIGAIEMNLDSLYWTQTSGSIRSPLATTLIADGKIAVSRTAIQAFNSSYSYLYKTASYNVTSTDFNTKGVLYLGVDATAGATTITLPIASTMAGRIINVKRLDAGGNTLTISGNGVNIDGSATTTLTSQYENIQIESVSIDGGTTFVYHVLARPSASIAGKANLAGGNTFTGTQVFSGIINANAGITTTSIQGLNGIFTQNNQTLTLGSLSSTLSTNLITTTAKAYELPNASGIIALTSDVTVRSVRSITASTTILSTDYTINVTSGTFTQTLPTLPSGQIIVVKNSGAGSITLSATSIDGVGTKVLSTQGSGNTLQSLGSGNYLIIGAF